jgi:S1-C subfamily serine protease
VETQDDPTSPGARVASVNPNSPAAAAGIEVGDLITDLDSKSVADSAALGSLVGQGSSGQKVTVHVQRGGRSLELHATLRPRPSTTP